ncbi:MAG: zinc-dependent metalloprotease [Armatimonadetes bacterium]|nr:zinc-dependent metalloprotease [Armatimonadota bacterium]
MITARHLAIGIAAFSLFAGSAFATAQDADAKKEQEQTKEEEQEEKQEEKKNPDVEKYEKAIKDLEKHEGVFTLYLRKKDLLLELPEENLEKLFLAQATLHTGFTPFGGQSGDPVSSGPIDIYRWVKKDDRLLLVRPNTRFQWQADDPLAIASKRTFPEAILGSYKIEQKHPEKKLLLVNVTSFFHGTVFNLQRLVGAGVGGSASLDRNLSGVDTIKNYDKQTVVRMAMHFKSQGGGGEMAALFAMLGLSMPNHLEDSRSIPLKVTYSLWYREESDYRPRLADPRVGFFTQDSFSLARFDQRDRKQRYIVRFDLRKKNRSAKLSEPVEPIVWYIDTSVPQQYRPGVRAGILFWNDAFERLGYKNAVVVKDAPADDPNWDHADGRHNVIRWIVSESSAYAVALFRLDPLTGQVLNAAVNLDANFPVLVLQDFKLTLGHDAREAAALSRSAILRQAPGSIDAYEALMTGVDPRAAALRKTMNDLGWQRMACNYAEGLSKSAALGWAALKASGSKVAEEDYMHAFLADLIAHEVGHCLGLRHNFAASTQLSIDDMLDDEKVRTVGLSASVMDYTPVNTPAILRGEGVFFNAGIGVYDKWAIEYGYSDITAGSTEGELWGLNSIAKRSGEPGHIYLTDGDADGINPLAVRYDLGTDPLAWLETSNASNDLVRKYAINRLTKTGESYAYRNRLILSTILRPFRNGRTASRFVGGLEMRRQFKGDVNEQPTLKPVSAQSQRRAMKFIIDNCLMFDSLDLPRSVLLSFNEDPNGNRGASWIAPLRSIVATNQMMILATIMSARKTDYIIENAFKLAPQDRYTITEHYNALFAAVYKEIGLNKNITGVRRDLQRFMTESLIDQASAPDGFISDDVRVIAAQGLKRLKIRMTKQVEDADGMDEMTVMHLTDMADRIDRYMKRQISGRR